MRGKVFLAAFLLGAGLCFVPALGYGEEKKLKDQLFFDFKASKMDIFLLGTKVNYMMNNPTNFLNVFLAYDPWGKLGREEGYGGFPESINTKGKLIVLITDNRGQFSHRSTRVLLELFKEHLWAVIVHMGASFPNIDTDVVAKFYSEERIPLGYFYQGEYHLWGE
ncbi:hypothetical protein ES702_07850 [subsurface metagenome]